MSSGGPVRLEALGEATLRREHGVRRQPDGLVAGLLELLRQQVELLVEELVILVAAVRAHRQPGEEGGVAGCRPGRRRQHMAIESGPGGEPVNVGCRRAAVAVAGQMICADGVEHDQDDVRPVRARRLDGQLKGVPPPLREHPGDPTRPHHCRYPAGRKGAPAAPTRQNGAQKRPQRGVEEATRRNAQHDEADRHRQRDSPRPVECPLDPVSEGQQNGPGHQHQGRPLPGRGGHPQAGPRGATAQQAGEGEGRRQNRQALRKQGHEVAGDCLSAGGRQGGQRLYHRQGNPGRRAADCAGCQMAPRAGSAHAVRLGRRSGALT